MEEFLSSISGLDIFHVIQAAFLTVIAFVEFNKKIPFHPISAVLSWIGKALNKEVGSKLSELEKNQEETKREISELNDKVEKRFQEVDRRFEDTLSDSDEKEAKRLRSNILTFVDSCRRGVHHSQSNFENIFRDYDDYIRLCEKREIPNHYVDSDYEYIQAIYHHCLETNEFL